MKNKIFNMLTIVINKWIKLLNIKFKSIVPLCRIEEIDLQRKVVVIHCKNINAPIKLTLNEIIKDEAVLTNLSAKQASWIGYYYGKYYKTLVDQKNYWENFNFSIDDFSGNCMLTMLDRRNNLIYTEKNQTKIISPINAIINENIITQFSPMQACYIGILAGIYNRKNFEVEAKDKVPLKIIK